MNVNLGVSLPSTELQALELAVRDDYKAVLNALVDIQAEKADTEWKEDKALIFDVIQKSAGGFAKINIGVKGFLRDQYLSMAKSFARNADNDDSRIFMNVASILDNFG